MTAAADGTPPRAVVLDPRALAKSCHKTLDARTTFRGEIVLPCIPAPLEHYVEQLHAFFVHIGRPLAWEELSQMRQMLINHLQQGFQHGADSRLVLQYETSPTPQLRKNLALRMRVEHTAADQQYQGWREADREGSPVFGTHPDARVMAVAHDLFDNRPLHILDIGAGNGRNALPLARLGHRVDAMEFTPRFVEELQQHAQSLPLRVLPTDFFAATNLLPPLHYHLTILSEVVSHFRTVEQLRTLMVRMAESLAPHGQLLMNIFLGVPGYEPDPLVKQMGEVAWACLFSRRELAESLSGLPLRILADDRVFDYEHQHLPAAAWPPTPWYISWVTGQSIFPFVDGPPPVEMRWILVGKTPP